VPYVLTCDDVTVEGKAMLVSIGNGSTYGGGMRICPDAVPHDGVLDVTWVDEVARTRLLRLFPSVYSGTHVRLAEVRTLRGREITVDAPGQVAYADGERLGTLPVRVAVSAAALTVVGPSSP
jgi:diacylglycerol kinase (ATP)